ncbi:GSCOCG00004126001-RA-CDS [Cotesia congregata]|uniref:Nucleolus and neural progenitor protein-like N-terminal domain-containing protein n=1 Tax=Cotesia congregata TaxID=51543 RepID=A0A8J2HUG1_COTCN|nr:GSCOCG00004126001-RA-CDS [Cotesia congregata]CAG5109242.1 Protein of unknown function [Cotesia congregata]
MDILWNQLELQRPPTSSWKTTEDEFDTKKFLNTLNKIYNDIKSQNFLRNEATILSRLIYRMKTKFRNDKGLKNMEKVNRALLNYLKLTLENEYQYLIDNTVISSTVSLPTKQMLQYVLIRTQGFAKLMCRIENVSKCAATFFRGRIQIGHAWTPSTIAYAILSRIWILSRHLVKKCCFWYNKIYSYNEKLKLVGIQWMPPNYFLPEDLKTWLSVSWIDEPIQSLPVDENSSDSIFSLIKPQDESTDEKNDLSITESHEFQEEPMKEIKQEEIGVPISRESFSSAPEIKKSPKITKKMSVKKIETEKDLNLLLTLDSYLGMDKLQWNIMKNTIKKKLIKLSKCKKEEKKKFLLEKTIQLIHDSVM